ncbi:MAG: hypothetical protein ACRCZI_06780 [Cetobacterium sp.]
MEELYYVDRPSVPAASQVVVRLNSILEHSVPLYAEDINDGYHADAVEVKGVNGDIVGTLVFFRGVTFDQLVSPSGSEINDVAEEESEDLIEHGIITHVVDKESVLLDLDRQLAAAKQVVLDIEDEIADEEGACD